VSHAPLLPTGSEPTPDVQTLDRRESAARRLLREWGPLLVAFSGGVDSSLVLTLAVEELGSEGVLAATAASPTFPRRELAEAKATAARLGVRHLVLETRELESAAFAENPQDRCFHCKSELMSVLAAVSAEHGLHTIVDGTNTDDASDYRPGVRAMDLAGARHPLMEAGLGKTEIRALAQKLGMENAARPATACLASRFPYGERISAEALARVEAAEDVLLDLGFSEVRVRHHGPVARLEVPVNHLSLLLEPTVRCRVVSELKTLGFAYVALDLEGFRSGSMNEVLASRRCET
jgi:pyridinium-3,5-biscarboxylic acid mononucleotide sulfurtransferase